MRVSALRRHARRDPCRRGTGPTRSFNDQRAVGGCALACATCAQLRWVSRRLRRVGTGLGAASARPEPPCEAFARRCELGATHLWRPRAPRLDPRPRASCSEAISTARGARGRRRRARGARRGRAPARARRSCSLTRLAPRHALPPARAAPRAPRARSEYSLSSPLLQGAHHPTPALASARARALLHTRRFALQRAVCAHAGSPCAAASGCA